jgi:23S rRNA pseudouridine1911/1915/1917 synthase
LSAYFPFHVCLLESFLSDLYTFIFNNYPMQITAKNEGRLSDLLLEEFKTASRSMIKKIVSNGLVTVNGEKVTIPSKPLSPGDVVEYNRFKAQQGSYRSPFPVLFEDDSFIVVDKPAGILTHAEKGATGSSLYKELLEYVREKSKGRERIYVVHRLDREVSGIVVFAKSEAVQEKGKGGWKSTTKRYWALVHGIPDADEGTLTSWLKEGREQKMYSVKEQEGAKLAITKYKINKRLGELTLLDIELETGRKNQIRVQLSDIGCPVVGDWRYGSKDPVKRRIRLHACYFSMTHPETGKVVEISSRMPRGFMTLGDKAEKY